MSKIVRNFCDSRPLSVEVSRHLQFPDQIPVERRQGDGLLVLKLFRQVDAIVLTDITDGLGWELLGLGGDAHRFEDGRTGQWHATSRRCRLSRRCQERG